MLSAKNAVSASPAFEAKSWARIASSMAASMSLTSKSAHAISQWASPINSGSSVASANRTASRAAAGRSRSVALPADGVHPVIQHDQLFEEG